MEDEAADVAILGRCRSFAEHMPLSAAMPFLVGETKQVAVHREVPGFLRKRKSTEYESRVVERETARGWRVLAAKGRSFEWVIQRQTGTRPDVRASGAINFCVSTDGEPMQVLVAERGAFAGPHPLIDSELKRQAALQLLEVRLGPAPRPDYRWLRERFDLTPGKGQPAHDVASQLAPHLASLLHVGIEQGYTPGGYNPL